MHDLVGRLRGLIAPVAIAHAYFDGAAAGSGGAVGPSTTTPPASGGSAAGTSVPPATGASSGTAGDSADPPKDGPVDLGALRKELAEARREAAGYRTKLSGYEEAETKARQAQMSEQEKLQAQIAELQKGITERDERLKAQDLRDAVHREATRLGFADPDDAMRLLEAGSIEYAEDGRPKNLGHLLGELARAKPYLKASFTQAPDLGQGNRGTAPGTLTRSDLAKMTQAQVMALPPAEIDAALARG